MQHETEFNFFCRLMDNLHLQTSVFPQDHPPLTALGLNQFSSYEAATSEFFRRLRGNMLYVVQDAFFFSFCLLRLPQSNDVFLIGPYLYRDVSETEIMSLLEEHRLSPTLLKPLQDFYTRLPFVQNEDLLIAQLLVLCDILWDGKEHYDVSHMSSQSLLNWTDTALPVTLPTMDTFTISEKRYEYEKELTHLVSQGRMHGAQELVTQMLDSHIDEIALECRTADPLRNMKNYGVVLNTLLRKAVEEGGVHPLHIGQLAAQMAQRLERMHTREECRQLFTNMVHKYCLLVRNHSMKGYSLLVQHVILRIEADLTADLSLKSHAEALNVNASYLSTLFKKETGMTLTDYVTRMRMDNAIFLLNTTDMQIQTIAQYCGVPDVNYFTKTFKRLIGKTPKEYRIQARTADTKES